MEDTWQQWVALAKARANVKLMDGRVATLKAVQRGPLSCKVMLSGRNYKCWVEDIALVDVSELTVLGDDSFQPPSWVLLPAWRMLDLEVRPGIETRQWKAASSQNWLKVVPRPEALHPAFGSTQQRPSIPPPPGYVMRPDEGG